MDFDHLGHPRGVMQFLPSVKSSELMSKSAYESYSASKERRLHSNGPQHARNWLQPRRDPRDFFRSGKSPGPKQELFRAPSQPPMRQGRRSAEFYLGPPPISKSAKSVGHRRKISVPEFSSFANSGGDLSPVWVPQGLPGMPRGPGGANPRGSGAEAKIVPRLHAGAPRDLVGRSPTFAAPAERRKPAAPLVRQFSQTGTSDGKSPRKYGTTFQQIWAPVAIFKKWVASQQPRAGSF